MANKVARRLCWLFGVLLVLAIAGTAGAALLLQEKGIAPRALAPYIEKRGEGHNAALAGATRAAARTLVGMDRGDASAAGVMPAAFGAQSGAPSAGPKAGKAILVSSADEAQRAFAAAMPGHVITFLPGTYRFSGTAPVGASAGTEAAPIVVRAAQPGSVTIEMDTQEGFLVSAPWWTFENLSLVGVCKDDNNCEHAFHVAGKAHHFVSRNNTITNFNAHFKINSVAGQFPDDGLIEANTLLNTAPRHTSNPVTPIDMVAASGWTFRRNLIADFIKDGGDRVSYGAFAKGAGGNNLFEQNAVLCEWKLRGLPGQRVGLSLGGGGTGKPYCRDSRCIVEQDKSELRSNLVAGCSDAGIYLNRAAGSVVAHNTVLDTAGVQARYPETSARFDGNLVDGAIHARNDAVVHLGDNLVSPIAYAYGGYHPVRARYKAPLALDFSWNGEAPRRAEGSAPGPDLCGNVRPAPPAYGAIEQFAACLQPFKAAPGR